MVEIRKRYLGLLPYEVAIGKYAYHGKIAPLVTSANINPDEYVLVQEGGEANYAMSMRQDFFGKNHLDTHIAVFNSDLSVPKIDRFMAQLINVNQALNDEVVLYDANGDFIRGERLMKYVHTMNYNSWVRLNGKFEKGDGYMGLDLVTFSGLENGQPVFDGEPLLKCLNEYCYADLESLNEQGLPTKVSKVQKYEPGKTVSFRSPKLDSCVWFYSDNGGATFSCNGKSLNLDPGIGVFASVENIVTIER